MRKQIYGAITTFCMFFGLAVATANAQAPGRVEVNIPFEFAAGKTTLKPGVYSIKRVSGNLLVLKNVGDKSSVILNAPVNLSSTKARAPERLVFNKDGDRFVLAQIWLSTDTGRELLKTNKDHGTELVELSLRTGNHVE